MTRTSRGESRPRTTAQNAYWWSTVVKLFAEHCGYAPAEMHRILKQQLLPVRHQLRNNRGDTVREVSTARSTSDLSTAEFAELITRAQQLGTELGIYVPDPGEPWEPTRMALRHLDALPTLADVQRTRRASPKPPATVIRQQAQRRDDEARLKEFLAAVWSRDRGRCRASGAVLRRSHVDNRIRGEVHHLQPRSTHPARRYDVRNGVLLSAEMHALAEAWPPRLDIRGTNADQPLTFILRNEHGREIWRHTSGGDQ